MAADGDMPLETLLGHLERLANAALALWDLPSGARARLINVSENVTYVIEAPHPMAVLRLHRAGYHSHRAIACELAWIDALAAAGTVAVPRARAGRNAALIQQASVQGLAAPRHLVMFDFVEGRVPDETGDLTRGFEELGAIAARMHLHAMAWTRPEPFERLTWDLPQVFGGQPTWGDWRAAPGVTPEIRGTLDDVEATVTRLLEAFGRAPDRYGLIHADMRLANLLVGPQGTTLIDFDDCGFGWFLYDFAAAISFIEDDPRIPALRDAWLRGYRDVRPLPDDHAREIDTFVMLRRMALLAWIGSHIEAPEPQALAPHFAEGTAQLGAAYLKTFGHR